VNCIRYKKKQSLEAGKGKDKKDDYGNTYYGYKI